MKVFVTGSNGFVGGYVVKQMLEDGFDVVASSRSADLSHFDGFERYKFLQVDITDPFALHDAFEVVKPAVVVHCAAMSKPDDCELNQHEAYVTNVEATVQLLLNAANYKSHFIHLSTDFVFNGEQGMHDERDVPDPISYYGKTKLEAEEAVREYEYDWAIVRTVFVYGKTLHGRDSFITMIEKKLKNGEPYKIVNDQERTPTFATDLARGISEIIKRKVAGVFHLCGKDILSPYEMAINTAKSLGISDHKLTPVTCKEFKEIAKRPLKSGLNIEKAKRELGFAPLSFYEGLTRTLGK